MHAVRRRGEPASPEGFLVYVENEKGISREPSCQAGTAVLLTRAPVYEATAGPSSADPGGRGGTDSRHPSASG